MFACVPITYSFRLTVLYTKKAPQLSAQELVVLAKKTAAAARRCCPLRDELQSACVEDQVSTPVTHLPFLSPVPRNQPRFLDIPMTYQWSQKSSEEDISRHFMPTVFT